VKKQPRLYSRRREGLRWPSLCPIRSFPVGLIFETDSEATFRRWKSLYDHGVSEVLGIFTCPSVLTGTTRMRLLLALLLTSLVPALVGASSAGTTSANFLKIGVGPRAIAMGEAHVGVADDVYATYWNPAGLATLPTREAAFTHTTYIQNISEQYLAYAHPTTRWGTLGASITYLKVGAFPGYDATGQPIQDVSAADTAFGLSYGRALYEDERYGTQLSVGGTGKWIRERLDTVSAQAFAGDFGVLFAPGIKFGEALNGWKAGMTLRNLGTSMKFDHDAFALPRSLNAGLSYTGHWREESITLALDGRQPNDGRRSYGAGVEISTFKILLLRGGYTSDGDVGNGFRVGGALRFKTVQVDYAYAGLGVLGNTHRFGVTFRFAYPQENPVYVAERHFERGMKAFENGRYTDALSSFNKTLEIDPKHPKALDMMKKTYEALNQDIHLLSSDE
jgi:hypothetical protein